MPTKKLRVEYKNMGVTYLNIVVDKESFTRLKKFVRLSGYKTISNFLRIIVYKETGCNLTPYMDHSLLLKDDSLQINSPVLFNVTTHE